MAGVVYQSFTNLAGTTKVQYPEFLIYFPDLINPTSVEYVPIHHNSYCFGPLGAEVYGSDDKTNFTLLGSQFTSPSNGVTVTIDTSSAGHYYRYLKLRFTSSSVNGYQCGVFDIYFNGTCLTTLPDYFNSWVAPNEHKWAIKY